MFKVGEWVFFIEDTPYFPKWSTYKVLELPKFNQTTGYMEVALEYPHKVDICTKGIWPIEEQLLVSCGPVINYILNKKN